MPTLIRGGLASLDSTARSSHTRIHDAAERVQHLASALKIGPSCQRIPALIEALRASAPKTVRINPNDSIRKILDALGELLTQAEERSETRAMVRSTREVFIVHACCISVALELWCEKLGKAPTSDAAWAKYETWFTETLGRPSGARQASSRAHRITQDTLWLIDFADAMARTSTQRDELPTNLGDDARRHLSRHLLTPLPSPPSPIVHS
ncbi:MAG: hypothetical protein H6729_12415 [Deltaproteobacteria bacterium]|nr:hypothetical protein [Deltaproteobacteria bacterium]